PAVVPVNVAVYVPFPLSVTPLNVPCPVPPPRANATVRPPVVSWVPAAFRAVRVTVAVLPTGTDDGALATVDCPRSAVVDEVTVMVGAVVVTAVPFMVAVMVLAPAVVPVNVAVYLPLLLSVTLLNVP